MSSLFGSNTPDPPNPIQTAAATTATNVNTAVANAFLNNVNQTTPQGNLTYTTGTPYSWTDPTSGQTYNIPTFTANQTLTPQGQAIQDLNLQTQQNLGQMGANQSASMMGMLSNPLTTSGAPQAGPAMWLEMSPYPVSGYGDGSRQQGTFGDAGNVTTSYGPNDFSADRSNVEQSLYQRMQPQLERDRTALESRLADQGIRYGSPAYQAAMDDFNRQLTDTRLGITQTAGQEQQRMQEMAQAQAQFQNQAQAQAFQEAQARGTFANQAQAANYQQAALQAQFYNAAAAQRDQRTQGLINAMNTQRQNYLNEQYALRDQPINEVTALMSGSQVSRPNFVTTPNNQIANTDIAGLVNTNFNQQFANYQQQSQNFNSLVGGLFGALGGIGSGLAFKSDRREKENINRIGTVFAASTADQKKKLPIYQYSYKDDPASVRHIGPMAQDVEKVDPGAVMTRKGVKYIKPARVMGSILRAV